jgi:CRISPR-associated endonuclease Cas1
MAASHNLPHSSAIRQISRPGVVTLYGFGIRVTMQRGHLEAEDGIGPDRRKFRLPRVGHGLKRLVIIGSDGFVSLAALRWLADQEAALVMLERDGRVLTVTGPVRPSDARLRRSQALAAQTGVDVSIARELISQKLAGQERVTRDKLHDNAAAQEIADYRLALAEAETVDTICLLESRGAAAYWAAWRDVQAIFPTKDLPRVPEHWRKFSTRKSPLAGSPRLASNPANAMLNYLYAVLESEARLAAAAIGLDPGLGFIHVDTPARDSLACDLMEPVRPKVDGLLLDWITREPLKRAWFFEQRDGNCRLMSSLAIELSQTARIWGHAVAPIAEWVARTLWSNSRKPTNQVAPPTRLTQRYKREARGSPSFPVVERAPRRQRLCRGCGKSIRPEHTNCAQCAIGGATKHLIDAARIGRLVSRSPEARAKRGNTQRRHAAARSSWVPSSQPAWLTAEAYSQNIQPLLAAMSTSSIASGIGVSRWYAGRIRQGYRPHPRHWLALAGVVGVSQC